MPDRQTYRLAYVCESLPLCVFVVNAKAANDDDDGGGGGGMYFSLANLHTHTHTFT